MRSIHSFALCCSIVLGLVTACGVTPPEDTPDASVDTPDASVPLTCDGAGVVPCNGACVLIASDSAHCGGCGKACATGEGCQGGVCVAVCRIDGTQVVSGTVNTANACEQCTPTASATTWTRRADGTSCDSGRICSEGACVARCFIDGVFYDAGAPNPANACQVCAPATSTTTWSPRASVPLLVGGTDVAAQGWTMISLTPYTLTYGADHVRLATTTNSGGRTSGQLLLKLTNAFDATKPVKLRMTMQVESVSTHNQLDSGAAILGSLTGQVGNSTDRSQMIYLDSGAVGWADDTQSAPFAVTDGAYHVYELAVDEAKVATVSVDGVAKLTRNNFVSNGVLAIGDQTNDPNVDGVTRIKSVERMCP